MARDQDPTAILELRKGDEPPPPGAVHLWEWFCELDRTRQGGGMGLSPLSRAEIRAWEGDECISLDLWERRAILLLDAAYISSVNGNVEDEDQTEETDEEES